MKIAIQLPTAKIEEFCHKWQVIDLITRKGIESSRNYLRRQEILSSARVIYATRSRTAIRVYRLSRSKIPVSLYMKILIDTNVVFDRKTSKQAPAKKKGKGKN
jgi:hypothetical protein